MKISTIYAMRTLLRAIPKALHRRWWEQKKRLVAIGSAYVPPNVARAFAYVKVA